MAHDRGENDVGEVFAENLTGLLDAVIQAFTAFLEEVIRRVIGRVRGP
jgi:hypothetical protein